MAESMSIRPRLKSFLTVFPISDSTWGVRGGADELWRIKLKDPKAVEALGALIPFLDGEATVEEIVAKLSGRGVDPRMAMQILQQLETSALLENPDPAGLTAGEIERQEDQIAFFSRFGTEGGARFQAHLKGSHVSVLGRGGFARALSRQLRDSGIGTVSALISEGEAPAETGAVFFLDRDAVWPQGKAPPDLLMVPQEFHDPRLLEAVDTWSKREDRPWMLLRSLDVQEGWVGPLFVPKQTACYRSLDARLRGNLPFYEENQAFDRRVRQAEHPAARQGGLRAQFELLSSVAVIEAVKYISGIRPPHLAGRFLTYNFWTWDFEVHDVLRVPGIDALDDASFPAIFPWKEVFDADDPAKAER